MEEATDREKERNRLRLRTSIAAVKWLTFQSCTFRGRDERPQSKNRGNFIEMLKLLAEFNPEIASVILENAPKLLQIHFTRYSKRDFKYFCNES